MELTVASSGQKCDKPVLRVAGEAGAALELALVRGMVSSLSPLSSLYARMQADNEVTQWVAKGISMSEWMPCKQAVSISLTLHYSLVHALSH